MRFVLNSKYKHMFKSIFWEGRCGALLLSAGFGNSDRVRSCILGIHGAHGDELADSLISASDLLSRRPRNCRTVVCGDLNVDFLHTNPYDWLDVVNLRLVLPEASQTTPLGR